MLPNIKLVKIQRLLNIRGLSAEDITIRENNGDDYDYANTDEIN